MHCLHNVCQACRFHLINESNKVTLDRVYPLKNVVLFYNTGIYESKIY